MEIIKLGSQPSVKGPEDWFTGSVRINYLFQPNGRRRAGAAEVTFEPGARTAWHTSTEKVSDEQYQNDN